MNVVVLHVFHSEPSQDYGVLRLASPGLAPDEHVVLWEGLAPADFDGGGIAPIVISGRIDDRWAYAERVPHGIRMSDAEVPDDLRPFVILCLLEALTGMHEQRQTHGAVGPDRVVLGVDGRVVLIGRSRRGGTATMDMVAALSMLTAGYEQTLPGESAEEAVIEIGARCRADDGERRAAWVAAKLPARPTQIDQVLLTVGSQPEDAADEVVPDLGPDTDGEGILDRWAVTTSSRIDVTAEVTHGEGGGSHRLALSLWTALAAVPAAVPVARFADVEGVSSRALRGLLADEPPDPLPTPLPGRVLTFLVEHGGPTARLQDVSMAMMADDLPTVHGADPPTLPTVELAKLHQTHRAPSRLWGMAVEASLGLVLLVALAWLLVRACRLPHPNT
jgi:hypothetical protein